jgi:hemolysin activation/secretion protein
LRTLSPHQDFAARAIAGWSGGVLPPQRQFAIGGIGSVHGYAFRESIGDSLALINLEYGLGWRNDFRLLGFFDAGRVSARQLPGAPPAAEARWLKGVGFGIAVANMFRIDFGYKLDAVPSSLQVLLRFGRGF